MKSFLMSSTKNVKMFMVFCGCEGGYFTHFLRCEMLTFIVKADIFLLRKAGYVLAFDSLYTAGPVRL